MLGRQYQIRGQAMSEGEQSGRNIHEELSTEHHDPLIRSLNEPDLHRCKYIASQRSRVMCQQNRKNF